MKLLQIIFLICLSYFTIAQTQLTKRIEIQAEHRNHFEFNTFYKHGAIIRYKEKKSIKYSLYDTKLNPIQNYTVSNIKNKYRRGTYNDSTSHTDYFLNYPSGQCKIVHINRKNETIKEYELNLPQQSVIHDFIIINDCIYFALYFKNKSKKILYYNINTYKYKYFDISHITFVNEIKFTSLNSSEGLIFIYSNKSKNINTCYINEPEQKIEELLTLNYNNNKCVEITATKPKETIVISALYSTENNLSTELISLTSITTEQLRTRQKIIFFEDLQTLKTKETKSSHNVQQHKPSINNGIIYWIGEFYEPGYRKNTSSAYINGKLTPPTKSSRSFEGYQYTQANLIALDTTLNLIYEKTFHLYPSITPLYLHQWLAVDFENSQFNKINFSWIDRSKIEFFSLTDGKLIKDNYRQALLVHTKDKDDDIQYTSKGITAYIENQMLVFGFQKITNRNEIKGLKARKVYFINVYK